jgi:hypothetical protein
MAATKRGEISNWQLRREVATLRGELNMLRVALGTTDPSEAAAVVQNLRATIAQHQADIAALMQAVPNAASSSPQ